MPPSCMVDPSDLLNRPGIGFLIQGFRSLDEAKNSQWHLISNIESDGHFLSHCWFRNHVGLLSVTCREIGNYWTAIQENLLGWLTAEIWPKTYWNRHKTTLKQILSVWYITFYFISPNVFIQTVITKRSWLLSWTIYSHEL